MTNNPTDNPRRSLMHEVRWKPDEFLSQLESYVEGKISKLPLPPDPAFPSQEKGLDLNKFSKEDIAACVQSERIFRETTIDEWLEIARDYYQDATGTKRRPKLFKNWIAEHWREHWTPLNRHFDPELMLNAVWLFGKDKMIDHAAFEEMVYSDLDGDPSWAKYERKADEQIYGVETFVRLFPGEKIVIERELQPATKQALPASENCRARTHMRATSFSVYDFAMGLTKGEGGKCWLSRNTTAKWCGIHQQTVRTAIDDLIAEGWLIETRKPKPGVGGEGHYEVVIHADWIEKKGDDFCLRAPAMRGK
jgi:hypothetical protein